MKCLTEPMSQHRHVTLNFRGLCELFGSESLRVVGFYHEPRRLLNQSSGRWYSAILLSKDADTMNEAVRVKVSKQQSSQSSHVEHRVQVPTSTATPTQKRCYAGA
jgi:hypothetical protein